MVIREVDGSIQKAVIGTQSTFSKGELRQGEALYLIIPWILDN